jgi:F-type H+-transporting ATPase subunit a
MHQLLAESFEQLKPGTKDFVWSPFFKVAGFPVNLITVMTVVTLLVVTLFFYLGLRKPKVVPGRLQLLIEMGIDFVRNTIIMEVIGPEGLVYLPLLASMFFFFLFANLFSTLPMNTSIDTRLAFPLVFALFIWVTYNVEGIRANKRHGDLHGPFAYIRATGRYLKVQCVPSGAPLLILLILVPTEFISNIVVRPFSLALRLFLNLMAGHMILALVFGVTVLLSGASQIYLKPFAILPLALAGVWILVEIFVALLQAFIFVILSSTYISSAIATEH